MPYIPKSIKVSEIKTFSGFDLTNEFASVLRCLRTEPVQRVPVVDINYADLDEFIKETGCHHSPETWIRYHVMNHQDLYGDVRHIQAIKDPATYATAIAQHLHDFEQDFTFEYDTKESYGFREIPGRFYEFDIPEEFFCIVPVDLDAPWFGAIRDEASMKAVMGQLAWTYMLNTLPITNIREVEA